MDDVAELGGKPELRMDKQKPDEPFLTDQRNYLLDCDFGLIGDPSALAEGSRRFQASSTMDYSWAWRRPRSSQMATRLQFSARSIHPRGWPSLI